MESARKWGYAINVFLLCVNRENGSLSLDPMEVLEYPFRTFCFLELMQGEFTGYLKEINEKAASKHRSSTTYRRK